TIVQVVSAPFALLVDAVSFLVSALCLKSIRLPMATPAPLLKQPSFWEQCAEGFHVIRKHALLRAIVCCSSTLNFGGAIILTVFTFYMINELHLSAAVCGIILGGGSLGSLAGAMLAAPLARWYGWGPTLLGTTLCWSMGALLLPLAHGPIMLTILLLLAGRFVMGTAQTTYNINQISLRQITLPGALHGRINATIRCLAGSAVPLGSFLGGGLGTLIGVRGTLLFGAISLSLSSCWLFFSPVRYVQKRRKATSVDPSRS
ncbi:MAG: MFS transporter, partial [Ktedonobacteraceae bacterium]|nr:MFS transporter [Ktedonobacteraceae bacterium]